VPEGLVAGRALDDLVAAGAQARRPGRGSAVLDPDQRRVAGPPDVERRGGLAAEHPARRGDGRARVLAQGQRPDQQLRQDLRLRVGAHGAEHGVQRAVVTGDGERGQRVRRPPPGPVLGRLAGAEREADPPVVQEDAVPRQDQPGAEVGRVCSGLSELPL